MATINLSVTDDQLKWVDDLTDKLGFANRSEFVRSIFRFLAKREDLLAQTEIYPFDAPPERSSKKVLADFKKTGKYSVAFLQDLEKGMKQSSYFD